MIYDKTNLWVFIDCLLFLFTFYAVIFLRQGEIKIRVLLVALFIFMALRYLIWRISSTLYLSSITISSLSIFFIICEIFIIIGNGFQTGLVLGIKSRKTEANDAAIALQMSFFLPSVDVYITTYDEPIAVVRKTIIGCQAIKYSNKKIYLLDDTQRSEMRKLASTLGCEYISRKNGLHAKAGNINNALAQTSGDLVAIFDADFIPTTNFLDRTVGFFLNQEVGLVQTNQSYYNPDPIALNLGIDNLIPHEAEMFSSHYQLLRDGVGASGCYGTSVVIRRKSLDEVGGFVTNSITEDYFTGINIACKGYKIIYLNEKLSAGLSAENMPSHLNQRLRWGKGTLQAFFLPSNPITVKGLNFVEKITHIEGILHWFIYIPRIYFFALPVIYSFSGITLISATQTELLYFCIPYYLLYGISYRYLNQYTRSFLLSDLYSTIHCIPLAVNSVQAIINPFLGKFIVTPKGVKRNKSVANWLMMFPLIVLLALEFSACVYLFFKPEEIYVYKHLAIAWLLYNSLILFISIVALVDVATTYTDCYEVNHPVKMKIQNTLDSEYWISGRLTTISENNALVAIKDWQLQGDFPQKVEIHIEAHAKVWIFFGTLSKVFGIPRESTSHQFLINIDSSEINLYRKLVEFIYCQPGQWKQKYSPNSLKCLLAIGLNIFNRKQKNSENGINLWE